MLIKLSCKHEQRYQLRVLVLVLLVRVQSPQLGDEDRQVVLDEGITVDEGLKSDDEI